MSQSVSERTRIKRAVLISLVVVTASVCYPSVVSAAYNVSSNVSNVSTWGKISKIFKPQVREKAKNIAIGACFVYTILFNSPCTSTWTAQPKFTRITGKYFVHAEIVGEVLKAGQVKNLNLSCF